MSFTEASKEKTRSTMYGAFILSWCICNWKILYITFFIDQNILFEKEEILKIEYIQNIYSFETWLSSAISLFYLFIIPALSCYLFVYYVSKLDNVFYNKSLETLYDKKESLKKRELGLAKLEKETAKFEKEAVVIESEKKVLDQDKWKKEYLDLSSDKSFTSVLNDVKKVFYEHHGNINGYDENRNWEQFISSNSLAVAHSYDLISFDEERRKLDLTEKGQFFMRLLLDINASSDINKFLI